MKIPKTTVTLKDVALLAGVSIAAVSYVLNNSRPVGKDVRDKVMAAADRLGYRPNALAQALKTGSARLVTCVVSNLTNPFIAAAVEGAHTVLRENGYGMLVFRSGPTPEEVSEGAGFAAGHRSAGLLIIHPMAEEATHVRSWIADGRPTAFAIHPHLSFKADHVLAAGEDGARAAAAFLTGRGHRAIALITRPLSLEIYASVARGYHAALRDAGIAPREDLLRSHESPIGTTPEHGLGYSATLELLRMDAPPTAIICAHNQIAVGALKALRDNDVAIPRDISLMSFDRVEWMDITHPRIASIGIDGAEIGRAAATSLVRQMSGEAMEPAILRLPLTLSEGESVATLKAA